MAKGGVRPNSGRKSKQEELRLSAIMDDIGKTETVLKALYVAACDPKNYQDRALWLSYKYGKPKENEGLPTEMIINVIRNG